MYPTQHKLENKSIKCKMYSNIRIKITGCCLLLL